MLSDPRRQFPPPSRHDPAKHLPLPLLDELQQRQRYLRTGRGQTVGKKARSRLYRMARMVMAGASMHEAAKQEVRAHRRGGHASDDAAVRYLRGRYAKRREDIEGLVAAMDQFLEQQREFDQQLTALADQLRSPALPALAAADEIRAQWAELDRKNAALADQLRSPALPVLPELATLQPTCWWEPSLNGFLRLIGPSFDWRNTGPKNAEKRSNDIG